MAYTLEHCSSQRQETFVMQRYLLTTPFLISPLNKQNIVSCLYLFPTVHIFLKTIWPVWQEANISCLYQKGYILCLMVRLWLFTSWLHQITQMYFSHKGSIIAPYAVKKFTCNTSSDLKFWQFHFTTEQVHYCVHFIYIWCIPLSINSTNTRAILSIWLK